MTVKELQKIESELIEKGYKKFNQNHKSSDYQWFKSVNKRFDDYGEKEIDYQLCVLL